MKTRQRPTTIGTLVFLAWVLGTPALAPGQSCTEYTGSVSEHFTSTANIDLPKSAARFWCLDSAPRSIMTLNRLGANFRTLNPNYLPTWINAVAPGDFDLDGWADFIGTSSSYSNVLAFVRNRGADGLIATFTIAHWIDGCTGDGFGTPTRGVGGQALDASGHVSLTSGDYDGDGDVDFLFVASPTNSPYTAKRIWLYKNNLITNGIRGTILSFTQVDRTSAWSPTLGGIAWSGTCLYSLKLDNDSDIDIVFGNAAGKVFELVNANNGNVNASTFTIRTTPLITTGWSIRGVSALTSADFDNDGDNDIIVGGVCYDSIGYYKNDGSLHFGLFASYTDKKKILTNNEYDGAATVILAGDFDLDGDSDFVVGTDNWNYPANNGSATGYGGKVYLFRNSGSNTFAQKLLFDGSAQSVPVDDLDCGIVFDYDNDGIVDFMIADGNHSEKYYLFINQLAAVYALDGHGVSLALTPGISESQYAITRVRMNRLAQGMVGVTSTGLTVAYYVSNNDGRSWELYIQHAGSNIKNYTDLPWHEFSTFGARLRWRAVLSATEDAMSDYTSASFDSPAVDEIALEYVYVEHREYSRTTDPVTTLTIGGSKINALLAATFYFPGYQGEFRAYDLTNIAMTSTSDSVMKKISEADPTTPYGRTQYEGAALLWDAGHLLNARSAASRSIYTSAGNSSLTRMDFTTANVAELEDILKDPDGDEAGLINFIRGENRDWKLGDIQHSNPVVLGPPSLEAVLMGSGYVDYANSLANRIKVAFVGANDGMLHCFNVTTGEELWGYIPMNLLSKLKNLSIRNPETGFRAVAPDYFVDGSAAVAEVQLGGDWRTVLVCGQGAGKSLSSRSGLNYYFALDVTDPLDPQPLWEISAADMGETWSIPAIGRVRTVGGDQWVAFTGSGYDNDPDKVIGNVFYTIAVDTGDILSSIAVDNVDTSTLAVDPYPDIQVSLPGSPAAIDNNKDGYTEAVYIGDLDGRMWKMATIGIHPNSWTMVPIYSDHMAYPIITRPALWQEYSITGGPVHVLFGTGGDDKAPSDRMYAFLSVLDVDPPSVEWYLGDPTALVLPAEKAAGSFELGEKAWADPVMADSIVYFNTLKGSIENINPCLNLAEGGKLYARFIRAMGGGIVGASALKTSTGIAESFTLTSKARRMVTIGERETVGGNSKREVYIQEYNSNIERLEQQSGRLSLVIQSWREVYQIIR